MSETCQLGDTFFENLEDNLTVSPVEPIEVLLLKQKHRCFLRQRKTNTMYCIHTYNCTLYKCEHVFSQSSTLHQGFVQHKFGNILESKNSVDIKTTELGG